MFTSTRKAFVLKTAIALLTLSVGCADLPEFYGPLCDQALTGEWSPASEDPHLDHIDYVRWPDDPELEQQLRSYGMDGSWEFLSGNDINEDGIVVSPYGKTLSSYELIVATPGLEGWASNLAQAYPVHGSCGQKAPGVVAVTWSGKAGNRIDVYELFYDKNVVTRAAFLIHESAHCAGSVSHVNDMDQSWDDRGSYRLQAEFAADVYHAEGVSWDHKMAALKLFEWLIGAKFIDPVDLTIEDLRPEMQGKFFANRVLR